VLFQEISILTELTHPCVAKIVGFAFPDAKGEKTRIVTEFMSNGSVEDAFACITKRNIPEFWTHKNVSCMIVGLVLGMKYLHSKNIIHSNLKPSNLLIDKNYRLQICDFYYGIFEDFGTEIPVNTQAYIAPECLYSHCTTEKSDVFSFGLILYEFLVGESVFPKDIDEDRLSDLHAVEWRPEIPNWISPAISQLIELCWAVDPDSRPTFGEIYDALEYFKFVFFDDVLPKVVIEYAMEIKNEEVGAE
jgi:serine/threonine protein kinase